MSNAELVMGLLVTTMVLYGVFAGADFGGGVWDLFAFGERKTAQREAIAKAIGPVWEANHVWLIFAVVIVFGCFPPAFSAVSIALFAPLHLIVLGIVLRGAAFVFRSYGARAQAASWGAVFGAASVITPWLMGAALGALAGGRIRVDGVRVVSDTGAWLSAMPMALGAFALAICAYQAAVFLCLETEGALREDFRLRALASGTMVVGLSVVVPGLLSVQAPHVLLGLKSGLASPVILLGVVASLVSGAALWSRRFVLARRASVLQTAALIAGWSIAQRPHLIYPDVTLANAQASEQTLRAVLWSTPVGMAVLVPSLALLYWVFKGKPSAPEPSDSH
ncbi:MAG: cytochrome d ubiquinol oxidase subunit II [Deltaproteobacteria bacterium]|nr:cytochrome d ubiquinol oxidase subunit II [Deltaproteobacteria bacterium]